MESQKLIPKRVVNYIHEMGVRALDRLAENLDAPSPVAATVDGPADPAPSGRDAVQTLIDSWKSLGTAEKEHFVERVATSVVEVVAASAVLPLGLKLGKQAAKATKKVLKREAKKLRKGAKDPADRARIKQKPKDAAPDTRDPKGKRKDTPAGKKKKKA